MRLKVNHIYLRVRIAGFDPEVQVYARNIVALRHRVVPDNQAPNASFNHRFPTQLRPFKKSAVVLRQLKLSAELVSHYEPSVWSKGSVLNFSSPGAVKDTVCSSVTFTVFP